MKESLLFIITFLVKLLNIIKFLKPFLSADVETNNINSNHEY